MSYRFSYSDAATFDPSWWPRSITLPVMGMFAAAAVVTTVAIPMMVTNEMPTQYLSDAATVVHDHLVGAVQDVKNIKKSVNVFAHSLSSKKGDRVGLRSSPITLKKPVQATVQTQEAQTQEQAQKIMNTRLSWQEQLAMPYMENLRANPDAWKTVQEVSAINGDRAAVIVNLAAETSAQKYFPHSHFNGPQTRWQITKEQFRRLLVRYGKNYAQNVSPEYKKQYAKQIRELATLAQFLETKPHHKYVIVRYDKYQQETGLSAADLDQRLRSLWVDPTIAPGMEAYSTKIEKFQLRKALIRDTRLPWPYIENKLGANLEERCIHYLGLSACRKVEGKILLGEGDEPVVGTIMSLRKAVANFPTNAQEGTARSETIQHMFHRQIGRWGDVYVGVKKLLQRQQAEQTLSHSRSMRKASSPLTNYRPMVLTATF